MRVTVLFTSIEGTLAALVSAAALSRNLAAEIVIHVADVVYFRYPLDRPPVPLVFFEKLCEALVEESHLDPYRINFEVHYCRDQLPCLEQTLREHSLVVIGTEHCRRCRREQKLACALSQLGHDVVLVHSTADAAISRSIACRMLS